MPGLNYFCPDLPQPAEKLAVADGVYWLRFPLPFALDHINLWLLEEGDGWVLVDTGFGSGSTRKLWEKAFEVALEGRPLRRIVVTHYHPDHIGQAGWLSERFRAPVMMTRKEWHLASDLFGLSDEEASRASRKLVLAHGLDQGRAGEMTARGNAFRKVVSTLPADVEFLAEGQTVTVNGRDWQVLTGGGHSPEHACLFCAEDRVLLAGDQVLPAISSNVSVRRELPDADPLHEYLSSLAALAKLPQETRVLPAHGKPFQGLALRAEQLIQHHREQLEKVEFACKQAPRTAADLLPVLFRRELNSHQLHFAMGESIAHANHLHASGRVERECRDQVYRFASA
jgi:glyoxylase-like metal-dependent hydrolase (beta-lactamase superfamily II)